MNLYTLGLLFSSNCEHILLIKKNRPNMGLMKLNGLGGEVESDDLSPLRGFLREVSEESGLSFAPEDVNHFGSVILTDKNSQIEVYTISSDDIYNGKTIKYKDTSKPHETIAIHRVEEVLNEYPLESEKLLRDLVSIYMDFPTAFVKLTINDSTE